MTALALTIGSIVATAVLYQTQSVERDRIRDTIDTQLALSQTLSALQDAETGQRGYLLTGRERYLEPFTRASAELKGTLDNLGSRLSDEQQSALRELRNASDQKLAELNETIALKRAGRDAEVLAAVLSDRGKNLMDQARVIVGRMQDTEGASLRRPRTWLPAFF